MHIICPHCTTSYAIDLATLGAAGRTVRCSRCKEVWLARPEDATNLAAPVAAMAEASSQAGTDDAAEWEALAREQQTPEGDPPIVDSPSIAGDWPAAADGEGASPADESDWTAVARREAVDGRAARPQRLSWFRKLFKP